jgi:hypothetical protein
MQIHIDHDVWPSCGKPRYTPSELRSIPELCNVHIQRASGSGSNEVTERSRGNHGKRVRNKLLVKYVYAGSVLFEKLLRFEDPPAGQRQSKQYSDGSDYDNDN